MKLQITGKASHTPDKPSNTLTPLAVWRHSMKKSASASLINFRIIFLYISFFAKTSYMKSFFTKFAA